MKLYCLGLLMLVGCGSGTEVPEKPGICLGLSSQTDGEPDPTLILWRPCEADSPEDQCRIRYFDRTETRPLTEAVACEDCYSPEEAERGCP